MNEAFYSTLKDEEHLYRTSQSKIGCLLAIFLVPIGLSLDFFVYQSHLGEFFLLRVGVAALVSAIYFLHSTQASFRFNSTLIYTWVSIIQLMICYMIYRTEGSVSTYYAGLNLVILAVGVLLPFTTREAILFCLFSLAIYSIACLLHGSSSFDGRDFFNNTYFIALTSIISSVACFFSSDKRKKNFALRYELKSTNDDLVANNEKLLTANEKIKSTQSQLVQSEKTNALGRMSAGLLHEINNPLSFSFAGIQLLKESGHLNSGDEVQLLDSIYEGLSRIETVVSDLKSFTHPVSAQNCSAFLFLDVLDQAIRFTNSKLTTISIDTSQVENSIVYGASSNIMQVLINLIANAADALEAKEDAIIAVKGSCLQNQRYKIQVCDNGPGITEDVKKRIFDPFYTTKDVGKGMGLGLSICQTIVGNHGGSILIAEEQGWTIFEFDLPLEEISEAITDE